MDVFSACQEISYLQNKGMHVDARNQIISLLDKLHAEGTPYPPVLNYLIREAGLYPYIQPQAASWQERFVLEAFKVDIGHGEATLHREQSQVLSLLTKGESLAVSAPTSFGKSFIIDAYIAANRPNNVVIIVPTIALMDETRRRMFKKFSNHYNIITASDMSVSERNIFIFPQERAFGYLNKIETIDLLVVDEFYKASAKHDKERSPALVKAILKLGRKASQKYYLAPNIKSMQENVFTKGMRFVELLDFNTVFLEKHDLYRDIGNDELKKSKVLLQILRESSGKSLIYAGAHAQVDKVANLINANLAIVDRPTLNHFAQWLAENYDPNWNLTHLVRRGFGVHNGKMHRSLSQLQVRLFENRDGFDGIISTSSIIEGVNTSAKNVIIWRNRLGKNKLKDFTYKNIIGRGGRMFRYFVGNIFLLEPPPAEEDAQLEIEFPETILGDLDEVQLKDSLTDEQVQKIIKHRETMSDILGHDAYNRLLKENKLQNSNSDFLLGLAMDMKKNPDEWRGFAQLNSNDPSRWERTLYKIVNLTPAAWEVKFSTLVAFVKALSNNWTKSIPTLLSSLDQYGVGVEEFFNLERTVTFKMASLISDVNELHKIIVDPAVDVSPFISKLARAFLPSAVFQLEEYGLPRMISKKIHHNGMINFENDHMGLLDAIHSFQKLGLHKLKENPLLNRFDRYILHYFYDGISPYDEEVA
jgi:hypothetical protein